MRNLCLCYKKKKEEEKREKEKGQTGKSGFMKEEKMCDCKDLMRDAQGIPFPCSEH